MPLENVLLKLTANAMAARKRLGGSKKGTVSRRPRLNSVIRGDVCLSRSLPSSFDAVPPSLPPGLPSPVSRPADCGSLLTLPPSLPFLGVSLLHLFFFFFFFFGTPVSPPFSCSVKVPSTSAQGVALISPMILFRCLKFRVGRPFSFHEAFYFLKLIAFCDWARPLTQGNES